MALFVDTETLSHDHIALTSAHLQLYELRAKAFIAGRLHLLPVAHRVSSPKGQLQDVWGKGGKKSWDGGASSGPGRQPGKQTRPSVGLRLC